MKKVLLSLVCIAAIASLGAGRDVAQLEPVQTVYLGMRDGYICLQTDTGAWGVGDDVESTLKNTHQTTAAFVFLDTADYLLITPELTHLLPSLQDLLRPSCRICLTADEPNLVYASTYLTIHKPAVTLKDYLAGERELPTLKTRGEGMQLVP